LDETLSVKIIRLSRTRVFLLAVMCIASTPSEGGARGEITVVGSSTVYPFSAIVAEHFAKSGPFPTPVVRSTSTSEGFRLFCAGASTETPDVSNASRPISEAERAYCVQNRVREIAEIRIGYDSLILANALKVASAHGYLPDEGLVPLPMPELLAQRAAVARLQR
jgi:phosphate transport system substrate-binding protein